MTDLVHSPTDGASASGGIAVIPPIISVDDHVLEPPDLWERWLPSRYKDRGPRIIRAPYELRSDARSPFRMAPTGPETDFWVYEGLRAGILATLACAGTADEDIERKPVSYEQMRPGCYDVTARLADMDINHVERSLCFPTFPRFCGQTFMEAADKDLALACVQAYNDWMVEEWCGDSRGRLIPLCLIPLWDPALAAAEVRRNAGRGVRAVAFSELPSRLGLPSIHDAQRHWDPFFEAVDEIEGVICMHIGSSSSFLTTSDDAPTCVNYSIAAVNSQLSLTDWLFSGLLARFPRLKLAYSESQIGWMPYVFERVDHVWHHANAYAEVPADLTEPPSSYVTGRVYGCFFEDDFGLEARAAVGIDQITFESDYPHQDSLWPRTREYAEQAMRGLPHDDVVKIVRGNAIRMLSLPERLG